MYRSYVRHPLKLDGFTPACRALPVFIVHPPSMAGLCGAYEASCSCSRWPGHHGYQGVLMVKLDSGPILPEKLEFLNSSCCCCCCCCCCCHDLWRCVSGPIIFQITAGSSQALRQLPGLNSAGKRSPSSLSICAAGLLINNMCPQCPQHMMLPYGSFQK